MILKGHETPTRRSLEFRPPLLTVTARLIANVNHKKTFVVDGCALILALEKGNDLIIPINKDNLRGLVAEFETEEVSQAPSGSIKTDQRLGDEVVS